MGEDRDASRLRYLKKYSVDVPSLYVLFDVELNVKKALFEAVDACTNSALSTKPLIFGSPASTVVLTG